MKLGARILKTGITLVLAIYISQLFNLHPVIYAAIAATLAIQPSVYRSWQYGLEQLQANIVGATIAIIFTTYIGTHPIFVAIAVMLVIGFNIQLRFERTIPLSIVTVLSIMEGGAFEEHFLTFAFDRFLLIFIGVFSAMVVNALLFPPKYDQRITSHLKNVEEQMASLLRIILDTDKNIGFIRKNIGELEKEIDNLWNLMKFEEESQRYLRRKLIFSQSRKLVILKTMLETAQFGIEMFKMIGKYQNTIQRLPAKLFQTTNQQLISLANYQDKIYSKFEGIIRSSIRHHQDDELFNSYYNIYTETTKALEDNQTTIEVVSVLVMIIEYNKKLDHLDKLIDSYHSRHQKNK